MIGSKAATFVKESCATNEGILDNVGEWLGYCYEEGVKEAYGEMVWHTDASPVLKLQYNRAAAAMIAHVKGIMCGVDSFGLNTKDAVALSALAAAVRHGEDNDGMVGGRRSSPIHCKNTDIMYMPNRYHGLPAR